MPDKPHSELERYWEKRWNTARADLEAARARVEAFKNGISSASGPDGLYSYSGYARAMMEETAALIQYSRVLRIYTDLKVHGKLPDGPDERNRK